MMKGTLKRLGLLLSAASAVALLATACGGSSSTPTPTATVAPTATATMTLAPTATVAPTTTMTAQPTATRTPTPAPTATLAGANSLTGAGATFPYPLYAAWFDQYNKLFRVQVNYQAIGSGGGVKGITDGTVDFAASDAFLTDAEQAKVDATHGPTFNIPMTSGSIAITYNLSGVKTGTLKLTGPVLASIYLKTITKWNDPQIATLNPGITLPNASIAVVHRSDGSGTTNIFTNYLSKVSPDWAARVGFGKSVQWPGDIGGAQNAGVAGVVQQVPNSVGYVELAYAAQNDLPWALLQNRAGNWEAPSIAGTTAAASGVTLPDNMKVMITDSANPDAYPITGFTWILVYRNQTNQGTGLALARLLWWGIHDGQQLAPTLQYGPLSSDVVTKAENMILAMNYSGQPLVTR